jgi:hypothetical protein
VIDPSAQRRRAERKKQKLIMTTTTKQSWMIVAAAALVPGWTAQFFGTTMTLFVAAQPPATVRFCRVVVVVVEQLWAKTTRYPYYATGISPHIHQFIVISPSLHRDGMKPVNLQIPARTCAMIKSVSARATRPPKQ